MNNRVSLFRYCKNLYTTMQSLFLHGFFTLLPTVITIALVQFLFKIVKSWLAPIHHWEPSFLQVIPQSEIILTVAFILLVGIFYELFLKTVLHHIEMSILKKIPLISLVYFGVKKLAQALSAQDKTAPQEVVLVEFPSRGIYSIGFLTGTARSSLIPHVGKKLLTLFVPHTPNPTSGFYVIIPEDQCTPLPISRQEAMTLVISGGLMSPENFRDY